MSPRPVLLAHPALALNRLRRLLAGCRNVEAVLPLSALWPATRPLRLLRLPRPGRRPRRGA